MCVWVPNAEPVKVEVAVCVWETTIASALPPTAATAYVLPAPTINLSRRLGVPFAPSHKYHPLGILAILPYHMVITPVGMMSRTNAVVAICVLSVVFAAVGAVGVPVNAGDIDNTTLPVPVEVVTPVPPLATAKVPVMSPVLMSIESQSGAVATVPVPTDTKYFRVVVVLPASLASVLAADEYRVSPVVYVLCPVPPLVAARVPVTSVPKATDPHEGAPEALPCNT